MILFSVVFALRAIADASVINCMHNLSRRIAIALQHEEHRCQYLTRESKLILAVQDEVTTMTETDGTPQSPFRQILPKCKLARNLKEAYDRDAQQFCCIRTVLEVMFLSVFAYLCTTGVVRLHINNWLEVSFCLPNKIHRVGGKHIPPEALERSLKAIRPYHALLLLDNEKALLAQLPLDCSPALVRLIKTCSAVKNLQQLAQDTDLALLQVFQMAAHLVYWGKAIIIYPLCENVYMLSPHTNICMPSSFRWWSGCSSTGCCFSSTHVCLLDPPVEEEPGLREEEPPLVTHVTGRSLSTPSALSFDSPTSSDDMTLMSPSMDNSSAELHTGGDSPLNKRMTETLLASLTEHEWQAILRVPAAQTPEDLRLFASDGVSFIACFSNLKPSFVQNSGLLHYFRGHHHLEEIMYNENMCCSQLKTLFDKFRSVLVITNHEDPIISLFQLPPD